MIKTLYVFLVLTENQLDKTDKGNILPNTAQTEDTQFDFYKEWYMNNPVVVWDKERNKIMYIQPYDWANIFAVMEGIESVYRNLFDMQVYSNYGIVVVSNEIDDLYDDECEEAIQNILLKL